MKLDHVDELDDAGEVFFLVSLGGEVLDGDGDGRVGVFLQSGVSVFGLRPAHFNDVVEEGRWCGISKDRRAASSELYLLEERHDGVWGAASSSDVHSLGAVNAAEEAGDEGTKAIILWHMLQAEKGTHP